MLGAAAVFEYGAGGFDGPKIFFLKSKMSPFYVHPFAGPHRKYRWAVGYRGWAWRGRSGEQPGEPSHSFGNDLFPNPKGKELPAGARRWVGAPRPASWKLTGNGR